MLYVTTRNDRDMHTAQRVLRESRGPDGGLYVPSRLPSIPAADLAALPEKSFNRTVADILNLLFQTELTSWDVDFAIGRYAVRLERLGNRVIVAELWHNLEAEFPRIVRNLAILMSGVEVTEFRPGSWVEIGVRIAVLFGIFGELIRAGMAGKGKKVDISLASGDLSGPVSAWYAREWGLPIGNIICACNENDALWNFICHGQMKTGEVAVKTFTPLVDFALPESLERLIFANCGVEEVERFLEVVRRGGTYYMEDAMLHPLRRGLYVTVAGENRVPDTIRAVFSTNRYVCSPYGALAYSGLQDYRARTGESRTALILEERCPLLDEKVVAATLSLTGEELKRCVDSRNEDPAL